MPCSIIKMDTRYTGGDGNGPSKKRKGKEDLKVSGFFHAPLAGHTTEIQASPPLPPACLFFQTYTHSLTTSERSESETGFAYEIQVCHISSHSVRFFFKVISQCLFHAHPNCSTMAIHFHCIHFWTVTSKSTSSTFLTVLT